MRAFLCLTLASLTLIACSSSPPRVRHGLLDYDPSASSGASPRASSTSNLGGNRNLSASWRGGDASCRPLTMVDRLRLLRVANPENFPNTQYRRGSAQDVEVETDCSHFVNEIYRRAGFPYAFRDTRDLRNAPEFKLLPEEEAMPGDLMIFRGHVGLVDNDGRIISSTRTHGGRRPSSITRFQRTVFHPLRGRMSVLRYRCRPGAEGLSTAASLTGTPASER